jgi:hypothetical protein
MRQVRVLWHDRAHMNPRQIRGVYWVPMRANRLVAGVFLASLFATPASAEPAVGGSYEVKFEEMSTNCDPPRFSYNRGTVKIDVGKSSLRVNIETIPQMAGVPAKSGKITAKTPKKLPTTVQGLDGKYSVSGRVDDSGVLQLVLVAEYTRAGESKTLCTQSWNVSGVRSAVGGGGSGGSGSGSGSDKKQQKSVMSGFLPSL